MNERQLKPLIVLCSPSCSCCPALSVCSVPMFGSLDKTETLQPRQQLYEAALGGALG